MSSQKKPEKRGLKRREVHEEESSEGSTTTSLVDGEPMKRGRRRRVEDKPNPKEGTAEGFVIDKSGKQVFTGVHFDASKLFSFGQKVITTVHKNNPKENCQNAANKLSKDLTCRRTTPIILKPFKKSACLSNPASGQQPPINPYSTYSAGQYVTEKSKPAAAESARKVCPATVTSNQYVAETSKPAANESAPPVCPATITSGQNVPQTSHPAVIEVAPNGAGFIAQRTGLVQDIPTISDNLNSFVPLSQFLYVTAEPNDQEEPILNLPILNVQSHQLNSTEAQSSIPNSEVQLSIEQIQQEQENEIMFEMPDLRSRTGDDSNSPIDNEEIDGQSSSPVRELRDQQDEKSYSGSSTASVSEQSDIIEDEGDLGERREEDNPERNHNINNNNNLNQLLERERETHDDNCCNSCRILLLQLTRKVDNILLYFENDNVNRNQRRVEIPVPAYDKLDMLPIDNIDVLKGFDKNLGRRDAVNRELEMQFRNKISNCGESDMKKAVVMTLPKILTNQLGTKLVWMIKAEGKVPIQNFNFPTIIASIFAAKYNCAAEDVKKRIKLWLQKSGDRIRADQRKAERNRDQVDD